MIKERHPLVAAELLDKLLRGEGGPTLTAAAASAARLASFRAVSRGLNEVLADQASWKHLCQAYWCARREHRLVYTRLRLLSSLSLCALAEIPL